MVQHYTTGDSPLSSMLDSSGYGLATRLGVTKNVGEIIIYNELSKFEQAALDIGKIVATKNAEYGNSAIESGGILKVLYKDVINTDTTNMLLVARILDKLSRISHAKDLDTVKEAFADLCGYGLIGYLNTKETMDLEKLEED